MARWTPELNMFLQKLQSIEITLPNETVINSEMAKSVKLIVKLFFLRYILK
jgi:hypothetical protein